MTIKATKVKAGRSYKVDQNGAGDVSIKYQVILDAPLSENEVPTSFTGVPKIGSEHPTRPGLYALTYDISQPEGAAKNTLDVTVKYGTADITVTTEEEEETIDSVTQWGWDNGTGDKELVTSVAVGQDEAKPVLNSAGDPFDSVPTVAVPTPTFTKVIRCSKRQSYSQYLCTVNDAQITIGDMVCPAGTLLCSVAESKLIGEWRLPYEYTVQLKYRSNIITNAYPAVEQGELGWDAAITDAGMRELDDSTNPPSLKLITNKSSKSNTESTVTSPELLNGHGKRASRDSQGVASPVVLTFHAYKRTSFPSWFYSEPPTPARPS